MPDHTYRILKLDAETPPKVLTVETIKALEKEFPNCAKPSAHFVEACCAAVSLSGNDGGGSLFILARVLKGSLPVSSRDMPYTSLLPYAIFFTEIMDLLYDSPVYAFNHQECVEIGDIDTLEVLFEQAWTKAIFGMDFEGEGEDLLSVAIKYSDELPETYFDGIKNLHKRRLLGIAEYLHNNNPRPFLLPQERLAEALGVSQPLITSTIQSLRKDDFLQVSAKANHLQGKAQSYTFKSPNQSKSKKKKPPIQ